MTTVEGASRRKAGLRLRFVLALLAVVTVTAIGFVYAVQVVVDRLEYELLDYRLQNELQEFESAYRFDPETPLLAWGGLRRYAAPEGELAEVPVALHDIAPGQVHRTFIGDRAVVAARLDIGATRLFSTIDVAPVEALKRQIEWIVWWVLALGYGLAVLVALVLSTLVTRPVAALARSVGDLDPSACDVRLANDFRGPEVGAIAAAFDQFLHRLNAFVAREQAFTEDASHELRTPLSTIRSAAELLQADVSLPEGARRRLDRILRAAEQMQALIEALLFLAREEEPSGDSCDLAAILQATVETYADAPEARRLSVELGVVESTLLRAPPGITACVVQNLVLNAIFHTQQGRVDIDLRGGVLRVRDTGSGIAEEDLERIFERRFRGQRSPGLGLGLYLVKRICDRLRWRIRVHSVPQAGACFEVDFRACVTAASSRHTGQGAVPEGWASGREPRRVQPR